MYFPIPDDTPGFGRWAREGEVPPELVEQAREAVRAAKQGRAAGAQPVAYTNTVGVGTLPEGVVAWVIRQGTHITRAFADEVLDDALFFGVDRLVGEDAAEHPGAGETRTLAVMADFSVRVVQATAGEALPKSVQLKHRDSNPVTARIIKAVEGQVPVHLPGVGLIRFVREAPDAR